MFIMFLFKQIDRLEYMHHLIQTEATGNPETFAGKLHLSRRQLYNILDELSDLGAEIRYSRIRQSFYYACPCQLRIEFGYEKLNEADLQLYPME
jgi:predicted DNA-binding transcriptional regulator YafY